MAKDEAGSGIPCCRRGHQSHPDLPKPPSWLHRWQPLPKVLGLMALMAAFASVRSLTLLPLIWALVAGLWSLSGLPCSLIAPQRCRDGLKRLAAPGLLVAGLMGILPFWAGETLLWRWGSLALRWEGLEMALRIGGRGLALFALTMLLLETTPMLELLAALRQLGIPDLLLELAWLTQRYLQEMAAQWEQMQRAARLRGWRPRGSLWRPGPALRQDLPFLAASVGTLLVRSYERSQRVYQALRLRGYGRAPLFPTAASRDPYSWAATALAVATAVLLRNADAALN